MVIYVDVEVCFEYEGNRRGSVTGLCHSPALDPVRPVFTLRKLPVENVLLRLDRADSERVST